MYINRASYRCTTKQERPPRPYIDVLISHVHLQLPRGYWSFFFGQLSLVEASKKEEEGYREHGERFYTERSGREESIRCTEASMRESNEFSLAGEPGTAEREGERATCGCPSSPGRLCTASCESTLQEMWKVSSRY